MLHSFFSFSRFRVPYPLPEQEDKIHLVFVFLVLNAKLFLRLLYTCSCCVSNFNCSNWLVAKSIVNGIRCSFWLCLDTYINLAGGRGL